MDTAGTGERDVIIGRIQELSFQIGRYSAPMKPFVRFACRTPAESVPFWDFDDLLQKKLLALLLGIAGFEGIPGLNIERWKRNLAHLLIPGKKTHHREAGHGAGAHRGRHALLSGRFKPGQRVLYIGCGTGKECFPLAEDGIRVTGVDTFSGLLFPAGAEARERDLPVHFSAMDMSALGFRDRAFDGFLLELYGFLPPGHPSVRLRREAARVLAPGGAGFVVALRKAYASHWCRAGSPYPPEMARWLAPQSSLDFLFGARDACEERLMDGFYNRCHTAESLTVELSESFEVLSCGYEEDPRYVLAVVGPKEGMRLEDQLQAHAREGCTGKMRHGKMTEIDGTLARVEELCGMMAEHAARVCAFFAAQGKGRECLRETRPDLERFMGLLGSIFVNRGKTMSQGSRPSVRARNVP